ncbi:hypothetical protein MtrunA17_Chr4g0018211 [Medicago truncatula]|uniref:Uncharacterized protein n=1 Tax=Medicago truncatula TaxID=3880 RepID=A0A396I6D5_MEDTR|nr:hypothetical protein MtrunA17_Chr4g0018211 [Medicago truncatula]
MRQTLHTKLSKFSRPHRLGKIQKKILRSLIPSTAIIGIMSKLGHISSGNKIKPTKLVPWQEYFGPIHQIFPSEVQEEFQVFNKRFKKDLDNLPIELNFFAKFSLTWIFSWQYKYGQSSNQMFYQCYKNKLLSSGGPVLIPQKQLKKVSTYGSKLIQNICRLQIQTRVNFSIK